MEAKSARRLWPEPLRSFDSANKVSKPCGIQLLSDEAGRSNPQVLCQRGSSTRGRWRKLSRQLCHQHHAYPLCLQEAARLLEISVAFPVMHEFEKQYAGASQTRICVAQTQHSTLSMGETRPMKGYENK